MKRVTATAPTAKNLPGTGKSASKRDTRNSVASVRGRTKSTDSLESNFDKMLLSLMAEVHSWQRFQGEYPIPYAAHDVTQQEEDLRLLRENIMLVVSDYNQIIDQLEPDERNLFGEHIRRLDKRV